jgi:hypothetical protein
LKQEVKLKVGEQPVDDNSNEYAVHDGMYGRHVRMWRNSWLCVAFAALNCKGCIAAAQLPAFSS